MKTVRLDIRLNTDNYFRMQGYAEAIKHKKSEAYEELTFKLTATNTKIGDKVTHFTPVKVVIKGKNKVDGILAWLRPMMLVTVEGHYQLGKNGGHCLAGQYAYCSEAYTEERDYNMHEESDERQEARHEQDKVRA